MIARWFAFAERGTRAATEIRAGVTTFMVMAYIIFVNPAVLGYVGVPGLEGQGLPFAATLTATCLTAGLLSIAMGLTTNYPLALAPGMGPAFVTMLVMPFTWSITNGIGAGFVTHTAIKVVGGRAGQVHWLMYVAAAAFVAYFALPLLERFGS